MISFLLSSIKFLLLLLWFSGLVSAWWLCLGAINGHMSIFLQFSVKIIQPIRHCKASKGGLFYVKPPSSLHNLNLAKHEEAMFNDSAVNEKKRRADMCQAGVRISGRGKNLNNCLNYFWRRFICHAAVTRIRFKQHSFAAQGWFSQKEPQSQDLKTLRG